MGVPPQLTIEAMYEHLLNAAHGGCGIILNMRCQERRNIRQKRGVLGFLKQVLFEFRAGDRVLLKIHVTVETLNDHLGINETAFDAEPQIKEVAPFLALIQRPKFGSK